MKNPVLRVAVLRSLPLTFGICGSLALLMLSGCSTAVPVTSSPPGAAVSVAGKSLGATPTTYTVENASKSVDVEFNKEGYFPKTISYTAGSPPQPISVTLAPTKLKKTFDIDSIPSGARVILDDVDTRKITPTTLEVEFSRGNENAGWTAREVKLAKADYQTVPFFLKDTTPEKVTPLPLALLKDTRTYTVTAVSPKDTSLKARLIVHKKGSSETSKPEVEGETPMSFTITYQRNNKDLPWPEYDMSVEILTVFKPSMVVLKHDGDTTIALKLAEITEVPVQIWSPEVTMNEQVGAVFKWVERTTIATIKKDDQLTAISDLKQVTNYQRQDLKGNRLETINSFTITRDASHVIYALTEKGEKGDDKRSNLLMQRTDDPLSGISRLTQGSRDWDTLPYLSSESSNENPKLVFTSNRSDRKKADIFKVDLLKDRSLGGVSNLAPDKRFNYGGSYSETKGRLYYMSVEPDFYGAEKRVSFTELNSTVATVLPFVAESINSSVNSSVPEKNRRYFVKKDRETEKLQIHYFLDDSGQTTSLMGNDESYKKANCFQPFAHKDGGRVLFVSDRTAGEGDRANNNIYVVDAEGQNLRQLTFNESDDTMPIWSPTEEGVIYFLSTRGGATNIWRMKLISGR